MPRSARYIFVLLLVLTACAGSLIFCTNFWKVTDKTEKYTPIFSGKQFTENELIQLELAFADAKLSDYEISNGTVKIPNRQKLLFLQALKKVKFLSEETVETQKSGTNLWLSEKEREAEALRDKQSALAAQIRTFRGIESAKILLDVSETKTGFTREKHATAAISIRSKANYSVTEADIQSILHLVTCSVCGLKAANVTIVDTRTNQSWRFDAPQIEILPESESDSVEKAEERAGTNRSPKNIKNISKTESLSKPKLFDCGTQEILLTSATNSQSGIVSQGMYRPVYKEEWIPDEMPSNSEVVLVSAQEPVPATKTNSGTGLGKISFHVETNIPESSQGLTSTPTNIFSTLPSKLEIPLTEKRMTSRHPYSVPVLLGIVLAPLILICVWVIYMTRKGILPSEGKKTRATSKNRQKIEINEKQEEEQEKKSETGLLNELVSDFSEASDQELNPESLSALASNIQEKTDLPDSSQNEIHSQDEVSAEGCEDSSEEGNSFLEVTPPSDENFESENREDYSSTAASEMNIPELVTLERTAPERLAQALLEERPQTVAMLLAQFQSETAREVLACIPTKIRLAIEARITGSFTPESEIIREAALVILEHLKELETSQSWNFESTEQEFGTLRDQRTQKSENFEIRPLARAIPKERVLNHFEDLKSCSDDDLRQILHETPARDVTLALLGAEPELVNRVINILPKSDAKELRSQLAHPGKIRLMEIEEARQRIVELASV